MIDEFVREFEACLEISQGSIAPETVLAEVDKFDSMGRLSVMAMADSKFGVILDADTLDACVTVGDLFDHINKARS